MEKRNFFSQVWIRLKADTPGFFNKISNAGKGLTAFLLALIAIPGIPDIIKTISGYGLTGGAVMMALPLLVVKNGEAIVYKDPKATTVEEIVEKANTVG